MSMYTFILSLTLVSTLASCEIFPSIRLAPDEKPMLAGSRVRQNTTILTNTFICYDKALVDAGKRPMKIAVGNISDYSGKTSDSEGAVITRGGSLMLFSALGLMPNSVKLQDRFDTSVTDMEMKYINARQLGDGKEHQMEDETVPWMPYFGGSILKSDYVILGGITEVNFNLASGGFSAEVNQIGFKRRSFTMSIAADLRLVKTDSLEVVATASFQKQFSGTEVNANVFSFFDVYNDKQLFDVYGGNIAQEPMQLGVRTILEESALELLAKANSLEYQPCTLPYTEPVAPVNAAAIAKPFPAVPKKPAAPKPAVAPKSATAPQPATAPQAAPALTGSNANLTIATFLVEANAKNTVQELKGIGITANVDVYERNGELFWIVGAVVPRDSTVLDKVRRLGFIDAYFSTL